MERQLPNGMAKPACPIPRVCGIDVGSALVAPPPLRRHSGSPSSPDSAVPPARLSVCLRVCYSGEVTTAATEGSSPVTQVLWRLPPVVAVVAVVVTAVVVVVMVVVSWSVPLPPCYSGDGSPFARRSPVCCAVCYPLYRH